MTIKTFMSGKAFANSGGVRFQGVSFTSDWLFPTAENKAVADAAKAAGAQVRFSEIQSDRGHDAFLLDEPELFALTRDFLASLPL